MKTKANPYQTFNVVIIACLVALTARDISNSPEQVVLSYYKHLKTKSYDQAYELHSSYDKESRSLQEFKDQFSEMYQLRHFQIIELSGDETKQLARVEVTVPDYSSLIGDLFAGAMKKVFSGETDTSQLNSESLTELVEGAENVPDLKRTEQFSLVNEDGVWLIFSFWKKEDFLKEIDDRIDLKDLTGALAQTREALTIDSASQI